MLQLSKESAKWKLLLFLYSNIPHKMKETEKWRFFKTHDEFHVGHMTNAFVQLVVFLIPHWQTDVDQVEIVENTSQLKQWKQVTVVSLTVFTLKILSKIKKIKSKAE